MQTRIQRWGNSLALRIPKAFAENLGLTDNVSVELTVSGGKLVVVPSTRPRLADLLADVTDANLHRAEDWGEPAGNEAW